MSKRLLIDYKILLGILKERISKIWKYAFSLICFNLIWTNYILIDFFSLDEAEEKQKAELREQAKKELEAWQKQRENEIAERKKKNR